MSLIDDLIHHRAIALENIRREQQRQVDLHARRNGLVNREPAFRLGDIVMRYNMRRNARLGDRLQRPWHGPYEVTHVNRHGTYRLRNFETGVVLARLVTFF